MRNLALGPILVVAFVVCALTSLLALTDYADEGWQIIDGEAVLLTQAAAVLVDDAGPFIDPNGAGRTCGDTGPFIDPDGAGRSCGDAGPFIDPDGRGRSFLEVRT